MNYSKKKKSHRIDFFFFLKWKIWNSLGLTTINFIQKEYVHLHEWKQKIYIEDLIFFM